MGIYRENRVSLHCFTLAAVVTIEDIALTMTPGVGVKAAVHLLGCFGDARNIFAADEPTLVGEAQLRPDVARALVRRTAFAAAEEELLRCRREGIAAIASTDAEYPPLLREAPDYPHVLYIIGNVAALRMRCLSVVGTREATPSGERMCDVLVRGLAARFPDLCIVSGLAFGIDVAAHRAALGAGAATVAVLASPLPGVTPAAHRAVGREIVESGGALVSELHGRVRQRGTFYLARNRIIAALSAGTVVVESPCGGGSLVTAHCADGYDRCVMAVPGRAVDTASRGTNLLIRNRRAQLVLSADDIAAELMWDLDGRAPAPEPESRAPQLTADEEGLLACFRTSDPLSTEELGALCGLGAGELSALLLGLEMAGAVRQLPGNRYVRSC